MLILDWIIKDEELKNAYLGCDLGLWALILGLISQGAVSILCWCNSAISHGFRLENGIVLSNVTANLGKVYQIVFISCTMCGYLLVMHLLV